MSAHRNGWQAEAFCQELLEAEFPGREVLPLAPSFPADLYVTGVDLYVEVKGSRSKWHALHGAYLKLSEAEQVLRLRVGPEHHRTMRVQTFPDGGCKLLATE